MALVLGVSALSAWLWLISTASDGGSGPSGIAVAPSPSGGAVGTAGSATDLGPPTELASGLETVAPRVTPAPATIRPTQQGTASASACASTDQDKYVYNPGRLEVLAPCIRVTGTVRAVRKEADGDLHILLDLDPPYFGLLRPANQGVELGDLVVEPVCVRTVTQVDAEAICARDLDPLAPPFPTVGTRVWMEGRYVLDLDHGGWAELHPLYRWAGL